MAFPFTIQVWKYLERHLCIRGMWSGVSIDERLHMWCNHVVKNPNSLPLLVACGIWLALNAHIFEGKYMYMVDPYVFFRVFLFYMSLIKYQNRNLLKCSYGP